ncbi:MAG: hypothetical protein Q7K45_04630, partial [Nanoarchaeota archaeon]|nr:hypothetical protein [Nanoarchaeota archaeon]
ILVQHPNTRSAHDPTTNAIDFFKNIGWSPAQSWTYTKKKNSAVIETAYTPGGDAEGIYSVPDRVWYVPLQKQHPQIAQMSLKWQTQSSPTG